MRADSNRIKERYVGRLYGSGEGKDKNHCLVDVEFESSMYLYHPCMHLVFNGIKIVHSIDKNNNKKRILTRFCFSSLFEAKSEKKNKSTDKIPDQDNLLR